jgi:hypothetical protein
MLCSMRSSMASWSVTSNLLWSLHSRATLRPTRPPPAPSSSLCSAGTASQHVLAYLDNVIMVGSNVVVC